MRFSGVMDSRDAIGWRGCRWPKPSSARCDPAVEIEILVAEGAEALPGTDLMRLSGNARAMLTAERSALNTVQHLSGIATMVRAYVTAMDNPACTLLDTRKTIPGMRHLEKYAVRMGGGANHRMGLWDAAMIKDNHVAVAGSSGARRYAVPSPPGSRRLSARLTGSTRSNRRWEPAQPVCCSTTWNLKPCARRWRWSPGGYRPKRAAGSISRPSRRKRQRVSITCPSAA